MTLSSSNIDEAKPLYVAIEAGGTKFVVSVGNDWRNSVTSTIATTTADETAAELIKFLRQQIAGKRVAAIGVASFGPVGIDPLSASYGVIGSTPKPGWSGFSYRDVLKEFAAPIVIDSDVNGAALAEARHGAGEGCRRVMYVTVGTGVGGGLVVDGCISNGSSHPELGHMLLPRHKKDLVDAGYCPYHRDCLEGLASGPSVKARWGLDLSELGSDHLGFELQAYYLAAMSSNIILQSVPDRIVLGGGVMQTQGLIEQVRIETRALLNGYRPDLDSESAMAELIQLPHHAPISGLIGAFELATDSVCS